MVVEIDVICHSAITISGVSYCHEVRSYETEMTIAGRAEVYWTSSRPASVSYGQHHLENIIFRTLGANKNTPD
jgi:hypothetical protein